MADEFIDQVYREINKFNVLCQSNHESVKGVPPDCKQAMRVLSKLYAAAINHESDNTYTTIVKTIDGIIRGCSGKDNTGSCGAAVSDAIRLSSRLPGNQPENLTIEDFSESLAEPNCRNVTQYPQFDVSEGPFDRKPDSIEIPYK